MSEDAKKLPGNTGRKDAKGYDLFKCDLCSEENGIFGVQFFYVRRACVCTRCQIEAVYKALTEKGVSLL